MVALNQASARLFVVPSSLGVECRILNGYMYLSANSVTDEATIARRAELFESAAATTTSTGTSCTTRGVEKVETAIARARGARGARAARGRGRVRRHRGPRLSARATGCCVAYDRLLEGLDRICHYHFELLNLGYGAYLVFYEVCRQAFPGHLRPDDREDGRGDRPRSSSARTRSSSASPGCAVELGVADAGQGRRQRGGAAGSAGRSEPGERWLADYEQTKDPWFNFSYGNGLYHHHRSWIDDPTLPIATIGSYIGRLEAGEDISRPREAILAERERITAEYRALLPEETREAFDEQPRARPHRVPLRREPQLLHRPPVPHDLLEQGARVRRAARRARVPGRPARTSSSCVTTRCARRSRSSGSVGARAARGVARGPCTGRRVVERRKAIYEAMRRWSPPPALGLAPEEITEPITIMLWGITTERVQEWLDRPTTPSAER